MKKLFILLVLFSSVNANAEEDCQFTRWSTYQGDNLYINDDRSAYAFRSANVHLDADGAPNAYHPDDMSLHCTNGQGFKGLDCPANAGYPASSWWASVLAPDPANSSKAYTQEGGAYSGYFVSKTSLQDRNIRETTNPKKYVDASSIPYFVFPGSFYKRKGTGKLGDLGYALNLKNGKKSAFVVADIGPYSAELGEMSVRLAVALGGDKPNPRTGVGSPSGETLYMIFPHSSKHNPWPMSESEIEAEASKLLQAKGGFRAVGGCQ